MATRSGMQVDVAELAGMMVEGPLFGICCVLDVVAIYILVGRKRYARLNIPLLTGAILMLALVIAQFIVDTVNIFKGFIDIESGRMARVLFFQDLTQPIFAAKHAIYFTMMVVGDSIVIYRAYVVWGKKLWIVAFPILCSLGSAACAYQTIWSIRHHPDFHSIFFTLIRQMGLSIFTLSFGANAISTSLIAYKIWKSNHTLNKHMVSRAGGMHRIPILPIIIESGAINTAYLLVYTVMLQTSSNGIEVMACIVTPLVGIIFSMVIIRATMASEAQAKSTMGGSSNLSSGPNNRAYYPRPEVVIATNTESYNLDVTTLGGSQPGTHTDSKHSDHPYKTEAL